MKLATTTIFGSVMHAAVASAQPAGAQAEILFRQGRDLLSSGKIAEACAAFDASEKLDPSTSTVLNQANCREKNAQLATAWGLYLEAERATRAGIDDQSKQMHALAAERAAQIEPRLSTLTIAVSEDTKVLGLEVVRDKDVVDVGAWNKALPIDGGTYRIIARAPGNAEWSTAVTVGAERDAKAVEIPRLKGAEIDKPPHSEPAPPSAAVAAVAADAGNEGNEDAVPREDSGRRWVPYAVGGGSVVLFGGALALELAAESTYDKSKANFDVNQQISLWHSANNERYVAEGFLVGGIAAAGVATWLFVRDHHTKRSVVVAPLAGGGRAGIQLLGGF